MDLSKLLNLCGWSIPSIPPYKQLCLWTELQAARGEEGRVLPDV